MPKRFRLIGAAVATAVAGSLMAAIPAAPAQAAPTDCHVLLPAYSPGGTRLLYRVQGKTAYRTVEKGNGLGWQPTALAVRGQAGDGDSWFGNDWATRSNGAIYDIRREGTLGSGSATTTTTVLQSSGWGATRAITPAYDYYTGVNRLYRLTSIGLYRYPIKMGGGFGRRQVVKATGWKDVRSMVYERSEGVGANRVDIFLANTTSGALREYRVLQSGQGFSYRTLRGSGFRFNTIGTGYCTERNGRPFVGVHSGTGRAAVYYDVNSRDSSGADISGVWTGASRWTAKAYGQ